MSCGCIYTDGDDDPCDLFTSFSRKARKRHKCTECTRDIEKGEIYEISKALSSGSWFQHKTCEDCLSVRREFFCRGYVIGSVWYDIDEHISGLRGELSSDCLSRLTPRAKDRVIDIIDGVFEWVDLRENSS